MRIVVAGGGIAGSVAALLLSEAGADVALVDPGAPLPASPEEAWSSPRSRCAQTHHTHNFLEAFWEVLRLRTPGVVDDVLRAGATSARPGDPLRTRRTTVATVLAQALARREVYRLRGAARAASEAGEGVTLLTTAGSIGADLVVDATGRHSRLTDLVTESDTPAGIVYLSRHYRSRMPSHCTVPAGFGRHYVAAHAVHDAGTFSVVLGVDHARAETRRWRSAEAFDRVVSGIPGFADLVDPGAAEAMHDVQVMGGLRNAVRLPRSPSTRVVAIGDALATSDPSRGRGCAVAATQAACLADLVRAGVAARDLAAAHYEQALDGVRTWVADARESSRWRATCWELGVEPAPLDRPVEQRTAWEWLQTPALDDDERRVRTAYAQMTARPEEVIAAGLARGDRGRTPTPSVTLPPIESLETQSTGACAR